ncbi:hypothetical protein ACFCV8_34890 [Streptomyces sp. NPDC056347]|uniref:hypothetical protein n=1 Tax=Streptomyces sp. NPDC056347 TaxID=3345790 RepID=UPI0035E11055
MGLDITVMIVDWAWLGEVPARERLLRLERAWDADETGLWDYEAPSVQGDWVWPKGPDSDRFAVYEFLYTLGSYKPHFWATHYWDDVRDHADPLLRAELDDFLLGLIWDGPDGESGRSDDDFFSKDPPHIFGLMRACSPESVRRLAATWERVRPRLDGLREPFAVHTAAVSSDGRPADFDHGFVHLLTEWARVLTGAADRGWGVVGLRA